MKNNGEKVLKRPNIYQRIKIGRSKDNATEELLIYRMSSDKYEVSHCLFPIEKWKRAYY